MIHDFAQPLGDGCPAGNSASPTDMTGNQITAAVLERIKSGDSVRLYPGETVTVHVLPRETMKFKPSPGMDPGTAAQYESTLVKLKPITPILDKLSERLLDTKDGKTVEGARLLLKNLHQFDIETQRVLRGNVLGIIKEAALLHNTRGSKLIPSFPREKLEALTKQIPNPDNFDWSAWLDHYYDPFPPTTQGFYLFQTPADEAAFRRLVISSRPDGADEMRMLFEKGIAEGDLSADDALRFDRLSQGFGDIQNKLLSPLLQGDLDDMNSRVRIKCDEGGNLKLTAAHYVDEFHSELAEVANILLVAANELPAEAEELKSVLRDQARWCTIKERGAGTPWGECQSSWVKLVNPINRIDINVCCEEKVSKIGRKADFHISVNQYEEAPAEISQIWDQISELMRKRGVNTIMFRTLQVGGHTSKYFVSGEKLPDPDERSLHKSMTFLNTSILRAVGEKKFFCQLLGISEVRDQ